MTTVLVHGVPETSAIWDGVRDRLDGDNVVLRLPGMGCPRPDGFGATMDDYATWLRGEIDGLAADGPVDLIGHDWGGILTTRVVMTGAPVRSWCTDAVGWLRPDYVWNDFAKIWQTPGDGEDFWSGIIAAPAADTAALFTGFGIPEPEALALVEAVDETMAAAILDLYRSAMQIQIDWASDARPDAPGLVLVGGDDILGGVDAQREVATALGARFDTLPGLGHWWMLQDPAVSAAALNAWLNGVR